METNLHRDILREVERDIADLTEKLRQLHAVADYHSQKLGIAPTSVGAALSQFESSSNGNGHAAVATNSAFPHDRFKKMSQRDAAAMIIRGAGRPLRAGDIARTMVEYGYPRPAKIGALTNSLFTSMTRDNERFQKVGPGLWTTRE